MINCFFFYIYSNCNFCFIPRIFPCVYINCNDKERLGFQVIATGENYRRRYLMQFLLNYLRHFFIFFCVIDRSENDLLKGDKSEYPLYILINHTDNEIFF